MPHLGERRDPLQPQPVSRCGWDPGRYQRGHRQADMSEVGRSNWLWRSAVAAPIVKGVLCGVVGVAALAYSLSNDGHEALLGTLLFSSSFAFMAVAAGSVAAAWLVAGTGPGWLAAERCSMG